MLRRGLCKDCTDLNQKMIEVITIILHAHLSKNSVSMVIGQWLYAFGGFQTQPYGQIGVDSIERLDITDYDGKWMMQDLAYNSGALGKKACFYLIDISNYLKQNS